MHPEPAANPRRAGLAAGIAVSVAAILSLSPAPAPAAGFYLGVGGGAADYGSLQSACEDLADDLVDRYGGGIVDRDDVRRLLGDSCDVGSTTTGFKFFGGWRFNPYVAVEGGYASLGSADDTFTVLDQEVKAEASIDALYAALVGSAPLGDRFKLLGKLGVANVQANLDLSALGYTVSTETDSTEVMYGVGAEFSFTPNVAGRLEWERFDAFGGVDLYSIGLVIYPGADNRSGNY